MLFSIPEIARVYIDLHGRDQPGAKYKIGTIVRVGEHECEILAVNVQDAGETEYLVRGMSVLVWEQQIQEK